MHDVARHAGVSQRTVSNVVNHAVHVAPATRARVEASLAALGYRPNVAARRLRSGRTGTVTLAIPGFSERYFADLAEAVIASARMLGIDVLVETTGGEHDRERAILTGRDGLLTDGVIMSAVAISSADEAAVRATYPLVLVGDHEFEGPVDHVGIPNRPAAHAAVTHLVERGRRRIALFGLIDKPSDSYSLRYQGYVAALANAGLRPHDDLVVACEWSRDGGRRAVELLLERGGPRPDGVFAMNDSIALGALDALDRHGLRVPADVAVVGFDDTIEARYSTPTLTSVAPRLEELAGTALAMLGEQLEAAGSKRTPRRRHVAFELRERESTAPT